MLNYLARLGWSHGDEELFSREQLVAWFDGSHLAKSPAQWDPAKLAWVNAQYIKQADIDERLAGTGGRRSCVGARREWWPTRRRLVPMQCALVQATVATRRWSWRTGCRMYFRAPQNPQPEDLAQHVTDAVQARRWPGAARTTGLSVDWQAPAIQQAIKDTLGRASS